MLSEWVTATIGVAGLIAAALVGGILAVRRLLRQAKIGNAKDELERFRKLYETALTTLDVHVRNMGWGDSAHQASLARLEAQMDLYAPTPVQKAMKRAGGAIEAWASEARQGAPKPMGDGTVLIASWHKPHQEKAESLWPMVDEARASLRTEMRRDLNERMKMVRRAQGLT